MPNILAVTNSMPVKTAAEYMAYAKANPGKVRVHVPYKGVQASYVDVIAGHVESTIAPYASMRPHLQAGSLRPLAVSTTGPSPLVPNLPTLVQVTGIKDLVLTDWYAVVAPSSMPQEYVAKMSRALLDIMKTPLVVDFTTTSGLQLNPLDAKQATEFIVSEYERMVVVARRTGIKMD